MHCYQVSSTSLLARYWYRRRGSPPSVLSSASGLCRGILLLTPALAVRVLESHDQPSAETLPGFANTYMIDEAVLDLWSTIVWHMAKALLSGLVQRLLQ